MQRGLIAVAKKRGLLETLIEHQQLLEKQRAPQQYWAQQRNLRLAAEAERQRVRLQEEQARKARIGAAQAEYEARIAEEQARDAKITFDNLYAADQLVMIDAILTKSASETPFSLSSLKYTFLEQLGDPLPCRQGTVGRFRRCCGEDRLSSRLLLTGNLLEFNELSEAEQCRASELMPARERVEDERAKR